MATTSYQDIIDAIDVAILAGVSKPGELSINGRTIKYLSLQDLMDTRDRYIKMLNSPSTGKKGFKLSKIQPGGPRA